MTIDTSPGDSHALRMVLQQTTCCQTLWQALTSNPFAGVQLLRSDGLVLYMNDQAAELFFGPGHTAEEYIGQNWRNMADPEFIEERLAMLRTIAAEGRFRTVRSVYLGRQLLSTVHPFTSTIGEEHTLFLVVSHHAEGETRQLVERYGTAPLLETRANQFGSLATLSPREIEVLALIAEGLSLPEISRRLHRSVHTINDHRKAIGRKLGVDDRVRLAEIARAAGLTTADAHRHREHLSN